MKQQLKRFQRAVSTDHPEYSDTQGEDEEAVYGEDEEQRSKEAFLKITQHFLRIMDQKNLADALQKSKDL